MSWLPTSLRASRWRIQRKIVIPFTALVIAVAGVAAIVTLVLFNRYTEQEVNRSLGRWLDTITSTGFLQFSLSDPDTLGKLRSGLGFDVVASYPNGIVAGGTLEQSTWRHDDVQRLEALLRDAQKYPTRTRTFQAPRGRYRLVHQRLDPPDRGVVLLTLMAPLSDVEAAQGRMAVAVAGVTAAGVVFVAFIASGIARTITGPIRELVDGTRRIATGNWDHPVRVPSRDEIGQLAVAFNRMTEELRASREKLIDAERLATAGQMAAIFAHEVRNPLSSMRMMLQLASEQKLEPKTADYVHNSIEEIDRLNAIVEEMLDFSRPATPTLAPCDVGQALSAVIALMQVTLADHGVEVAFSPAPNVIVAADEDALKRAFLNVLLNATQAQAHSGRIDATVEIVGELAHVVIEDHGPGFSDEALENLFRPFATTKTRGTGLGLVTTKRILEQHGGDVRIENRPAGGAKVTMSLPLEQP